MGTTIEEYTELSKKRNYGLRKLIYPAIIALVGLLAYGVFHDTNRLDKGKTAPVYSQTEPKNMIEKMAQRLAEPW